ncbi:MAG: cation transporter [Planctomycetes bacterium]|nr:cation transporter [Planctomycetota bacterium]
MISRSMFQIDCTDVIPECGFECAKCVQEIGSSLTGMKGVGKFYTDGEGVTVEYDAETVTAEQLKDVLEGLPSFYESHFVPSIV